MEKKTIIIALLLFVVGVILGIGAGPLLKGTKESQTKCKENEQKDNSNKTSYYLELIQNKIKKVIEIDEEGNMIYKENDTEKIKVSINEKGKKMLDDYFESFSDPSKNNPYLINKVNNKYFIFTNADNNYYYQAAEAGKPKSYTGNNDKTYFENETIVIFDAVLDVIKAKHDTPDKYKDNNSDMDSDELFVAMSLQRV